MRNLKFGVCLAFALAIGVFEFYTSGLVTGQSGGSTLAAPTNLTASDNAYSSKVGLFWDTIRGATLYRIFRNTVNNPVTATDVGSTASNSFFDASGTPGQTFFYWVRAENGTSVSSLSTADQGTRANAGLLPGPVPPLDPPPIPPGNPVTATKAALGKALFWDEQMSSTRTVACGTCHHSSNGGTDPRSVAATATSTNPGADGILGTPDDVRGSAGVPSNNADGRYVNIANYGLNDQVTGRKTVSYVNAAYAPLLFWDGRASNVFRDPITNAIVLNNGGALESQATGPPVGTSEMAHAGRDWNDVAARISTSKPLALTPAIPTPLSTWINGRNYPELFQEAFGTPEATPARIALAIATFERTLYSDRTPWDSDAAGITPLTAQEQRGRGVFNASNCAVCHAGNLFTDQSFRYIGVRPQTDDTGRFQQTGNNADLGAFRVPSLRNVELRGSYFHNGQFTTLEQVVAFYNRGGDFNALNKPTNLIRPLGLNANQQADLVAFLKRPLTDPRVASESERFDHPLLYMESNRVPQITGVGRSGSGGFTPQIRAISPPIIGNPNFTVSTNSGLGNTAAVLVIDSADPGTGTSIPASGSFEWVTTTTQNTGAGNGWASLSLPIPDDMTLVGKTFFARWYIQDASAASGFSVSQAAKFTVFGQSSVAKKAPFDFDGDGMTDISIFRPDAGQWWYLRSKDGGNRTFQFGAGTDKLVPGDYTGDGTTDIAFYRKSTGEWFVLRSEDFSFYSFPFGSAEDIPVPADYDGDGKTDAAVFRPSSNTWFIQNSNGTPTTITTFGVAGDRPVPADYDGDGKADIAIYRPANGQWWLNRSRDGGIVYTFGTSTDKCVPGYWTGDGKADIAFWRPSTGEWFILRSEDSSYYSFPFGNSTDTPSPGDYDGDGKFDAAVFRSSVSTWYIQNSKGTPTTITPFGVPGDLSVPNTYVR